MLSLKNKNQKVYYFSLRTKVCERKSVIFILAIFQEYLFAWIRKIQIIKKKIQFFWVEINHKVAWGERGGTNKKIELHYLTHGKAY
jgi:hypothetical protein